MILIKESDVKVINIYYFILNSFLAFLREQQDSCGKLTVCQDFEEALKKVSSKSPEVETVWVIGGHSLYKVTAVIFLQEFTSTASSILYSTVCTFNSDDAGYIPSIAIVLIDIIYCSRLLFSQSIFTAYI